MIYSYIGDSETTDYQFVLLCEWKQENYIKGSKYFRDGKEVQKREVEARVIHILSQTLESYNCK